MTIAYRALHGADLADSIERLFNKGLQAYIFDGDNVRNGINADLGFAPEDRAENIRRVGEMTALIADAGLIVISAFISPYHADRDRAREAAPVFDSALENQVGGDSCIWESC